MSDLRFQTENTSQPPPTRAQLKAGFILKAPPGTDLWAKPPSTIRSNAPIIYHAIPLSRLQTARVHVSGAWTTLYDQGGLVLILPSAQKWIKSGIEFVDGMPYVSTVTKDNWADWSLAPVPDGGREVVIEMVREKGALWVYVVRGGEGGETRMPVREVTWAFAGEQDVEGWIGVYGCRPAKEGGELELMFRDFEVGLSIEA
ncbi:conserved hypothetical protein [Uncinocarpus reesii 1704]|uniref:DUF1349 domain-containing protein n=1 Tax=Uncinocarpus reesii (strain UAMH 1704) TaxID=336963 RepID=C4JDJ1_UNCRE|nr:uncharacterized protein UREG_00751 [Uncinocarpus reesii 1704]EEP75904.1 conserved hypothetical protein [Uncinocarpus reesii 1704]